MMTTDALGLYVHVPFCKRKCNYCDFCSYADVSAEQRTAYIEALCSEIKSYSGTKKERCNSIFFGGGTPSLLLHDELSRILSALADTFEISPEAEITIEINPGTASYEKLVAYKALGINRLSIGLQSIHENELKILGRIHTFQEFVDTYTTARNLGFSNISVDLMYGIPEQTSESFTQTLNEVIRLSPEHISAYSLIIEPGTNFYLKRCELSLPSEEDEYSMYESAVRLLSDAGYSHYEISNYARAGYESRHNLKYWRLSNYIGFGLSAYSMYCGKRYGNVKDMSRYISGVFLDSESVESVDSVSLAYEYVMLGLRLSSGISLSEYKNTFGSDFLTGREQIVNKLTMAGLMKREADRIYLTDAGLYVSNSILTDLI